jgi:hypothetical protein
MKKEANEQTREPSVEIHGKCKECHKPLPNGNSLVSQTAREMGYCRYCYQMNNSMRPAGNTRKPLPGYDRTELSGYGNLGAEVFDPESPWDWYESFMPESER